MGNLATIANRSPQHPECQISATRKSQYIINAIRLVKLLVSSKETLGKPYELRASRLHNVRLRNHYELLCPVYLDLGLRYLFVSKQYAKLVGLPRERLIGRQDEK